MVKGCSTVVSLDYPYEHAICLKAVVVFHGILFCIKAFVTAMQEQHITFAKQKQKQTNKQIINVKADDRGEYSKGQVTLRQVWIDAVA